ncbi:MAG: hypothetical protein PWQ55_100 [Chloroflexota bacterium]|nr:hypothetical protein [Chloroflexota bacterium]
MKRLIPFLLILLLIALGAAGCQKTDQAIFDIGGGGVSTPEYAATPERVYSTPLPPFSPMQFAWFYKPPQQANDLGAVAANFSMLVLTRNDERERQSLRDMGNTAPVLQYLRFEAIMDPGSCTAKPFQNQVAHLEGDFCQIEEQHPDWFLRDVNGNLIRYDQSQYVLMDPGNEGWRAYFLDKVRGFQQDNGWAGVFLDNVDGSLGRFDSMNLLLTAYPDDASYQAAVKDFLAYLRSNYFAGSGKLLYANIPYIEDENAWLDYLTNLDGAMLEAFAADWNNGYRSVADWQHELDLAEKTQAAGRSIILVTQGNINDTGRMQFGLASFLLVNNGRAYFRYSNDKAYRELWWYPQFESDLGQPLGPRYPDGDGWRRDFERGSVYVDPQQHSAEIQVD